MTLEEAAAGWSPPKQSLSEAAKNWQYTVPESEFKPATPDQLPKEKPGFLKTVEMIGSGAAQGSLEYTGKLLNQLGKLVPTKGTFLDTKQKEQESPTTRAYKYWEEKNKADAEKYEGAGLLQTAGSLPMEMITTAPLMPAFSAVSKGAELAGKVLPRGLKKLGEYGTAAGGGALALSALEGAQFNPEKPDEPFSLEQAGESLKEPLNWALPAGAHAVGNFMTGARAFNKAREVLPNIEASDLTGPSLVKSISQTIQAPFSSAARETKKMEGIGDDISNYINELSGNIAAKYSKDYKAVAAKEFQGALQSLKQGMDDLWNQPFKSVQVSNPQDIKNLAIQAQDILKGSGVPYADTAIKLISKGLQKDNFTIEDVKGIASTIGKVSGDAYGSGSQIAAGLGKELSDIRHQLIQNMDAPLSLTDQKALETARKYSSMYYNTIKESPKIEAALYSELDAKKVINSMMSEAEAIDKAKTLGLMTETGQKATYAARLAKALEDAGYEGANAVNLDAFVKATRPSSQLPELMGDTYKAIEGLNVMLKGVQQNAQNRPSKLLGSLGALGTTLGVGAGIATGVATLPALVGAVSYAAIAGLTNKSPLKKTLGYFTQKLSDSGYKALVNKVEDYLVTAGYFLTDDGVLDKEEKK